VTHLRKVMLEELQRCNFSAATIRSYIGAVERFARYFGKPPDKLGPEHIREWQAHLLHKRKLAVGTVVAQTAGLRFFFVRTLKRRFPPDSIPYPKYTFHRVPKVLSPEEVAQLIDAASNLQARAILMRVGLPSRSGREMIIYMGARSIVEGIWQHLGCETPGVTPFGWC
jgi:integrase/recombinase XerD